MNTEQDITHEIRRRRAALKNIYAFVEYMRPSGHPDFLHEPAPHHRLMLDAFQKVADGELKRLMIFMPPGGAKSTWLRVFCAFMLARNTSLQMLRVMASQNLAERQARNLRATLQEREFALLTGDTLAPDVQAAAGFATTSGGFVLSAGVGSTIIGTRGGVGIIDDPVPSWEYIQSESQRNGAIDWYWSEYRSRLIPGAPEVIVSTRWHHNDLPGAILNSEEGGTWEVIRLPMVAEDESDPLGRAPGERLWPEWFTQQMVEEQQRNPEIWAGMYQQTPYSTVGDFLASDDLPVVDEIPDGLGIYASIDLALTEKQTADATVILIAGFADDGTLYIIDMVKDRCSPEQTLRHLMDLHRRHNFRECLVEDSPAEKVFRDLAHKFFRQEGAPIPLTPMPTRGRDKMARAQSFRGLAKMGAVLLKKASWNADLIREAVEFPHGRHDDLVDALALLGRRASKMSGSAVSTPKNPPPVQGAITIADDGLMTTASTMDELWTDNRRKHRTLRIGRI